MAQNLVSTTKLAQIFSVFSQYMPTKASVYLRPKNLGNVDYFNIETDVAIDALNFSELVQLDNKLIPLESFSGYTGNGSLVVNNLTSTSNRARVSYPIKLSNPGNRRIRLKIRTTNGNFDATIYLDGNKEVTISETGVSTSDWVWITQDIDIPSPNRYILGIEIHDNNTALDKIFITPITSGMDNQNSYQYPFITIHSQVYTINSEDEPVSPLFIYDYRTTIKEVRTDDWYNFSLNFIDESLSIDLNSKYALVLFSSGSNSSQYIVWELVDSDEYISGPSAIKA